MKALHFCSA